MIEVPLYHAVYWTNRVKRFPHAAVQTCGSQGQRRESVSHAFRPASPTVENPRRFDGRGIRRVLITDSPFLPTKFTTGVAHIRNSKAFAYSYFGGRIPFQ